MPKLGRTLVLSVIFCFPAIDYGIKGRLNSIGIQPNTVFGFCDEGSPEGLRRGSPVVWFALVQKVRDPDQIIGQHRRAHQNLEPRAAFEQAAFHASPAK